MLLNFGEGHVDRSNESAQGHLGTSKVRYFVRTVRSNEMQRALLSLSEQRACDCTEADLGGPDS